MICENCGSWCTHLHPCPCELADECLIAYGVCNRCRTMIIAKAAKRRHEHRRQHREKAHT